MTELRHSWYIQPRMLYIRTVASFLLMEYKDSIWIKARYS